MIRRNVAWAAWSPKGVFGLCIRRSRSALLVPWEGQKRGRTVQSWPRSPPSWSAGRPLRGDRRRATVDSSRSTFPNRSIAPLLTAAERFFYFRLALFPSGNQMLRCSAPSLAETLHCVKRRGGNRADRGSRPIQIGPAVCRYCELGLNTKRDFCAHIDC